MIKELNLYNLGQKVLGKHLKQHILLSLFVGGLSAIYVFSLPRYYTATTQVIPESSDTGGVNLPKNISQLSSLAGVSLSSLNSKDAINPDIYPDIFNSNNFIVEILETRIKTSTGKTVRYYEYLTLHQKEPWWSGIVHLFKEKNDSAAATAKLSPTHFTRQQEQIIKSTKEDIRCLIDQKTGMISLTTEDQDPVVAAQLANAIMQQLQRYIIRYRTSKAKIDLDYIQQQLVKAKKKYEHIQQEYIAYSDSHQDVVLEAYRTKLASLENEMQLAFNSYTQIGLQVDQAKAKLQERIPAFTIIQEAPVPVRPAGPKRMFTVLGAMIATFIGSLVFRSFQQIKSDTDVSSSQEHIE